MPVYQDRIIGGIGKHRIRGTDPEGRIGTIDVTLPFCVSNGFVPRLIPESAIIKTTSYNTNVLLVQMEEFPMHKGYWMQWEMSYENFPIGKTESQNIIQILNYQQQMTWLFWPNYDDNPNWKFLVNIIAEEITPRPTKANEDTPGMINFRLTVRSKTLQKTIDIPVVPVTFIDNGHTLFENS